MLFEGTFEKSSKYLEAKDIIELALRYSPLSSDEIIQLCLGFNDSWSKNAEKYAGIFPLYLYKLFVFYEQFELFEKAYQQECKYFF